MKILTEYLVRWLYQHQIDIALTLAFILRFRASHELLAGVLMITSMAKDNGSGLRCYSSGILCGSSRMLNLKREQGFMHSCVTVSKCNPSLPESDFVQEQGLHNLHDC